MVSILDAAKKLLHKGRYYLFAAIGLVILFVGFALRGYVPVGWGQPLQVGPTTMPASMAQGALPDTTPTGQAGLAFGVTTTPVLPGASATRKPGVGIVITMTPAASNGQQQAPTLPATPGIRTTQIPPANLQPTGTQPLATSVPSMGSGQPRTIPLIKTDMQNLYRIMQVTLTTMQTLMQGQLTNEEITAMQAQVNVIALRMKSLLEQLQVAQSNTGKAPPTASTPSGTNVKISPEQVRDLLNLMQQAMANLQIVLADPSTDSATLARAQILLGQLQGMIGQLQILVAQMQNTSQPGGAPATATPVVKPSATATPLPTATRIPTTVSNSQLNQYQALMVQMEQMLRQMQTILQQQQNQRVPSINPTATP